MQTAADCRKQAQDCIDFAEGKSIPERAALLRIAGEWLRLAALADLEESLGRPIGALLAPSTDTTQ